MANAVCIGGGSQDAWINLSAEQIVTGFGFGFDSSDPLVTTYQAIAKQYNPYAVGSKWYPGFLAFAEACMRTRAILFCNSEPGDCTGSASSVSASDFGTTETLASVDQSGIVAVVSSGIAKSLGAVASAVPIVGQAAQEILTEITQAFAAHAQAEARQSTALCRLAPELTANIVQIDAGVSSGQYDPISAGTAIAQMANQFQSAIASLTKNCNAFCMYTALIKCLAEATPYYYDAIAPVAAPTLPQPTIAPTPVGVAPVLSTAPVSTSLVNVAPLTATASGITLSTPILVGIAVLVLVVLIFTLGGNE